MFSGIVAAIGRIIKIEPSAGGVRLGVSAARLGMDDVAIGDSIAVGGVCLTVVAKTATSFEADVSAESLAHTCGLAKPGPVNLEKALRANDRLGGHIVSGHVDGLGKIIRWERSGADHVLDIAAPPDVLRYLVFKGCVAVDGISLTVAEVFGESFRIWIIPNTHAVTALRERSVGDVVNLEADLLAKYVERLLVSSSGKSPARPSRKARSRRRSA